MAARQQYEKLQRDLMAVSSQSAPTADAKIPGRVEARRQGAGKKHRKTSSGIDCVEEGGHGSGRKRKAQGTYGLEHGGPRHRRSASAPAASFAAGGLGMAGSDEAEAAATMLAFSFNRPIGGGAGADERNSDPKSSHRRR